MFSQVTETSEAEAHSFSSVGNVLLKNVVDMFKTLPPSHLYGKKKKNLLADAFFFYYFDHELSSCVEIFK